MGKLKKLFQKARLNSVASTRPGGGDYNSDLSSRAATGIAAGDRGTANPLPAKPKRPGRRGPDSPMGPGRNRM